HAKSPLFVGLKGGAELRLSRCNRLSRTAPYTGKDGENIIMARRGKLVTRIAAVLVVWLASSSAMALTFVGELPVGYSDSMFQINGGTSSLAIDVNAFGSRDPATCGSCNSSYADSYTV